MEIRNSQIDRMRAVLMQLKVAIHVGNMWLRTDLKNRESSKALALEMVLRGAVHGEEKFAA